MKKFNHITKYIIRLYKEYNFYDKISLFNILYYNTTNEGQRLFYILNISNYIKEHIPFYNEEEFDKIQKLSQDYINYVTNQYNIKKLIKHELEDLYVIYKEYNVEDYILESIEILKNTIMDNINMEIFITDDIILIHKYLLSYHKEIFNENNKKLISTATIIKIMGDKLKTIYVKS